MIEKIEDIHGIELNIGQRRIKILCNYVERYEFGILGRKKVGSIFISNEDVFVIHTNLKEDGCADIAEFDSIKKVLDEMGIKIIG